LGDARLTDFEQVSGTELGVARSEAGWFSGKMEMAFGNEPAMFDQLTEEDLDETSYQGVFKVLLHDLPGSLSAIVQPPGQRRNPSERCLYYGR